MSREPMVDWYLSPSPASPRVLSLAALLIALLAASPAAAQEPKPAAAAPVKVIFDTDMDSDCDDVGAIAVLHALADLGEADILATVVSTKNPWSAPCVDAINTYYGRGDLPIGEPKGAGAKKESKYARPLATTFPRDLEPGEARDAMDVYREVLSSQPDGSVVIVTVGYLTNVADLLKLPAKGDLPSGMDLVKRKVRRWVCMGGNFIGRPATDDLKLSNNNFTYDKAGSLYAVQNWPGDLTFVGREIGSVPSGLKAGAVLRKLPAGNPIRRGYELWFGGEAKDRHVADPTTVLFAVRGARDYWDVESKGYMDLNPDMTFRWRDEPDKPHEYLLKRKVDDRPNDRYIEKTLEDLMLRPPGPREGGDGAAPKGPRPGE